MKTLVIGVVACGWLCVWASADVCPVTQQRTEWFKDAQWGVFCHYLSDIALAGKESNAENWNAAINAFDVDALANQLASIGAKYFVITLGQNSGYFLAPNATYDDFVGYTPGHCAQRDLVSDIHAALEPRGIRLMVYLPAGAPDRDPVAMEALGWKNGRYPIWSHPDGGPDGGDPRLEDFQRKWEAVIADWSTRWGTKVSGWWFDGCYFPKAMYDHPDAPNYASFAAAARAGNPDSIVAFNPGVFNPMVVLSGEQDYAAGEINDPQAVQSTGRWIDGVQFHMLTYLGPTWAQSPPRFSAPQVIAITRRMVEQDGVVTWDVPIMPNGAIPQNAIDALSSLQHELALPNAAEVGMGLNSPVVDGFAVTPREGGVTVAPGTITVDGHTVTVETPTNLDVAPVRVISVRDEATTLSSDEPKGYGKGTGLIGCLSIATSLEGCLVPDSLVVKAAPGVDASRYEEGKDWRADKAWGRVGRLAGGAIGPDTTVYIDYDYSLMRLDGIEVLSNGEVVLRRGAEHKMVPQAPLTDANAAALCNVFMPYGATSVTEEQIYPIGAPFPAPRAEDVALNASYIEKSREKLDAGGPFTLLFWGDSVTCGGDASSPDKAFPQAFTAWLRNAYPQAQIAYVNAGTGGWNSDSKLPLFQEEVIDKKPDLVVIEFVNDMGMNRDRIFANYTEAVKRIREIGGEVIIVTPHFVRPDWMPVAGMRAAESRTAVTYLREFAATNHIALADTSRRWEHLWREGVPYLTFLYNGINHPEDRGHQLFVEELQRLF